MNSDGQSGDGKKKGVRIEGVKIAAELLNSLDAETRARLLANVAARDGALAERIGEQLCSFDDLVAFTDESLRLLLREVSMSRWAIALRKAPDEIKDAILRNLSERTRAMLEEDIAASGPRRISEIEAVQKEIASHARRLEEAGRMVRHVK